MEASSFESFVNKFGFTIVCAAVLGLVGWTYSVARDLTSLHERDAAIIERLDALRMDLNELRHDLFTQGYRIAPQPSVLPSNKVP